MLSPGGARGVQRLNSTATLIQRTTTEAPQGTHVLHRTRCSQENDQLLRQGCERADSSRWQDRCNKTRTRHLDEDSPAALDGWDGSNDLYRLDLRSLLPHAKQIKVAHPLLLRAIAAAKKKNDRIDAGKIADCLRCDFLPECHMASTAIRDRRRTLRYRQLLTRQMVQMKNRISGLLMETGVSYNKRRLHKVKYFRELLTTNQIPQLQWARNYNRFPQRAGCQVLQVAD